MNRATQPLHWRIEAAGAVTAVGTRCWQSAASWATGIRRQRRRVIPTVGRNPVTVAACEEVAQGATGPERLARLLAVALADMLTQADQTQMRARPPAHVSLALPQFLDGDSGAQVWTLTKQKLARYGFAGLLDDSHCYLFLHGSIGGMRALGALFQSDAALEQTVVLAGVDSLADTVRLCADYAAGRLMTSGNAEGWIAGEAAAALLLRAAPNTRAPGNRQWVFHRPGIVEGLAPHFRQAGRPPPDALAQALGAALEHARWQGQHVGCLMSDHDGSRWRAQVHEAARQRIQGGLYAPEWLPASVTGQVGAASAPLHWALAAQRLKVDATPPNSVLCSLLDDGPWAGAVALERSIQI